MDIRIGNDIRIDATITDYIESDQYCIKRINCVFINTDKNITDDCQESFPQFCTPSGYTIHNNSMTLYNAMPILDDVCDDDHAHHHGIEHSPEKLTFLIEDEYSEELKDHISYEPRIKFDKTKSLLLIYFPGKHLYMCGSYKLMIFISLYDKSWEEPHIHTVVTRLNDIFNLIYDDSTPKRVLLNCKISLNDISIYDVLAGKDGLNSISINILSNQGLVMVGTESNTTLTASIFDGRTDITQLIPKGYLSWTRVSNIDGTKTPLDLIFDMNHRGVGSSITVPTSDVNKKIQYYCSFDLDSYYK